MGRARSLWFAAPGRVEIRATPLGEPAAGQVLVRTTHSGISAGTELLAYRGQLDPDLPLDETIGVLGGTFRYPFRYGYSCAGVVEQGTDGVPAGATVFAFHPHQDRFVVDAEAVVAVGPVGGREATMYPLVETALQIALDAGPVLQDTVVVFGLGAVGLLTCLLLRRSGARVLAAEPQPWRRDLAGELGVTAVAPDELPAEPVPLVIEASGNPAALRTALPLLAHEGTALVASWYGSKEVGLPLGGAFHRRRLTIRSTQVSTIPARLGDRWTPARRRRAVLELLPELPLARLATHTFAFDEAPAAYAALDAGEPGVVHAALGYG